MKQIIMIVMILSFSLMFGHFNVRANSQDSVTRWEPISNSIMSFGRMTMYENRNSAKTTWKKGQSSPSRVISDGDGETIIFLTAAPKFDGVVCRYIKMAWNENEVTVSFYSTKNDLNRDNLFMQGTYEQIK